MFRASFLAPDDVREELLDALLPLLPAGVRDDGDTLYTIAAVAPDRAVLEAAAGRALEGWAVEEVPADWRVRRALEGGEGSSWRGGSRSGRPGTRRPPRA